MSNQHLLLFSLIFTTMNDQLTGATGKLGIFGRTLSQINNDLSNKQFASLFHIIPKSEVSILQNYGQALLINTEKIRTLNKWLSEGRISQQQYDVAFKNHIGTLEGCSSTTQILGKRMESLHRDFMTGKIDAVTYTQSINAMTTAQKSAAVASKVLSTALKVVFNMAIITVINAIVTGVASFVDYLGKASERAKDAAKSTDEHIKSLDELKEKYLEIISSDSTEIQKTKELDEWKNTLIKTYGLEKSILEQVNEERQTGIGLIEEESRKARELWLGKNEQAIQDAKRSIETDNYSDVEVKNISKTYEFVTGIRQEILDLFDSTKQEADGLTSLLAGLGWAEASDIATFSFDTDNIYETKERVEKVITEMGSYNYELLTYEEKQLLNSLNNYLNQVDGIIEKHGDVYTTYQKYIAQNTADDLFSDYIKEQGKALVDVTEQSFDSWKEGLLSLAGESISTKDALETLINNLFPQYVENIAETQERSYKTSYELGKLGEKFTELGETIDGALSNQSTIQSAFDKIKEGASLTSDEMIKLTKLYPELLGKFTETANGWTIGTDALVEANKAVTESAKTAIEAEKALLQGKIDELKEKINFENIESLNPDLSKIQALTEEINKAEQEMSGWDNLLKMFGLDISDTTEKVSKYNQIIKDNSSKVNLIASAMKEMTDDGHISASTYAELVEKGGNFTTCLEIQNGKLVLNIDKLKELEKQEYLNMIVENNLAIKKLETTERTSSNAKAICEEIQAYKTENALLQQMADEVGNAGIEKPQKDTSDPIKEAFEKDMKDIEHLHNMGLKSDKEYYDALEKANEKHYKNSVDHESDYLSNVEKIYKARQSLYKDDADKQFDALEKDFEAGRITANEYVKALKTLSQSLYGEGSIYGGTEFAIKALEELDKKVKETSEDIYDEFKEGLSADGDKTLFNVLSDAEELWNKTNELFDGDLTSIKSNAKDIFGTVSSALEDALKKGIITVDGYESLLRSWADTLQVTEADITDALVDTYEYRADALQKANDGSLASERKYIADMKALNFSTYGDENSDFYDPTTYASNLRDITDHQLDVLEKALNNGKISVQEYANSVVEIFKDADVLGADYVSEKLDDIDKVRAEREKTYWEQQKELMEDYYDKQIKEIEDTQKAKEKENKLEELHLKLIKLRQTLEEAKNNRNQLVFHDGTFEYMADQDAIMSAEEEVANTLKEIEDEKLQAQIDLLEEQKDAALGFYDQILDEIDFYLNKTLPLSESDQEELAKMRNSDYAQYARDKRDGNLTANSDNEKIAEDALNQIDTAEETKQSVSDIAKNVLDIAKVVANGFNFENLVRALGGNPTAESIKNFQDGYNATLVGKQIVPSTLPSNITNNSSTTNNSAKTVNIGDIHLHFDLTLNSLDEFVDGKIDEALLEVGRYVKQKLPAILAKA